MDNDYAGGEVSGRLKAVSGLTVTLDRDVEDSVGRTLSVQMADRLKTFKIMAQPAKKPIGASEAVDVEAGSEWVLMGRVKPRLYRIIGTKENAEEGTFEVTGILHDPTKYAAVDNRARFETNVTTLHGAVPKLSLPDVKSDGDKLLISWDNLTADGGVFIL
ncbi:putative phage tail protein [Neisseria flavescens]|nr:putative phage tail protein [Neisseria flavescens]